MNTEPDPNKQSANKSSTGMEEHVAGLLCYVLGFVTGIVFLVIEKKSRFVRFHAMQSIIVFGGLFLLDIVLGFIPIIGIMLHLLISPISLILWIILMVKAYQKSWFKLPVVGEIAVKQLDQWNR